MPVDALAISAVALPLALAAALASRRLRAMAWAAAPGGAVPALLLLLSPTSGPVADLPWILFGARLQLDGVGRVCLLLTAVLWLACGIYARGYLAADPRRYRFAAFFLASMAGNLGVVLAGDVVTFYGCFALMSFASYGLIVHDGHAHAVRSARIYIVFVIAGEVLLFVGIAGLASLAGSLHLSDVASRTPDTGLSRMMLTFVLAGFAIKAAAVPLHMWLPLAHGAAPAPASACLSGSVIKAGLLGWLRFLPLGGAEWPAAGAGLLVAGFVSAFWGVIAGITQRDAKAALGYSSISQMGLIAAGVGAGLLAPNAWPVIQGAVLLYALHHALAKASLFLGVGVAQHTGPSMTGRRLAGAGLVLPALALAGVPLTSGAAAKSALKDGLAAAPLAADAIGALLSAASVGTTVLMCHVLGRAWPRAGRERGLPATAWMAWMALVGATAAAAWLAPLLELLSPTTAGPVFAPDVWDAVWPAVAGGAVAWSLMRGGRWSRAIDRLQIPAGDLVVLLESGARTVHQSVRATRSRLFAVGASPAASPGQWLASTERARRTEALLHRWPVVGMLALCLALTLLVLLDAG